VSIYGDWRMPRPWSGYTAKGWTEDDLHRWHQVFGSQMGRRLSSGKTLHEVLQDGYSDYGHESVFIEYDDGKQRNIMRCGEVEALDAVLLTDIIDGKGYWHTPARVIRIALIDSAQHERVMEELMSTDNDKAQVAALGKDRTLRDPLVDDPRLENPGKDGVWEPSSIGGVPCNDGQGVTMAVGEGDMIMPTEWLRDAVLTTETRGSMRLESTGGYTITDTFDGEITSTMPADVRRSVVGLLRDVKWTGRGWSANVVNCCGALHKDEVLEDVQRHADDCPLVAFCERWGIDLSEVQP
jgi:hypothetical protein